MLTIRDLHASVDGKQILRGLDLDVKSGEVHAIMGPNGSGKSTLAQVLAGRDSFTVDGGSVSWDGRDLLGLAAEERAREGLFLAFQYPVEIPGVSNAYFLKAAVNAVRRHRGLPEFDAMDFLARVKSEMKAVGMKEEFLYRAVNEGFSGGEKKRNEVLQMAVAGTQAGDSRRDRLGPGHRRDAHRRRRRQPPAQPRSVPDRHHPLPAPARLHRP